MEKIRLFARLGWSNRHKIIRFIISGTTATAVDFLFLYIFTDWLGVYYVKSVVLAFVVAVGVSFVLQKFWTFKDRSTEGVHKQLLVYLVISGINTALNAVLVYGFVEYGGFHYLVGQFLSSAIIALESFFIYHFFIFKKHE